MDMGLADFNRAVACSWVRVRVRVRVKTSAR